MLFVTVDESTAGADKFVKSYLREVLIIPPVCKIAVSSQYLKRLKTRGKTKNSGKN